VKDLYVLHHGSLLVVFDDIVTEEEVTYRNIDPMTNLCINLTSMVLLINAKGIHSSETGAMTDEYL
jgi:hypothetical protein